MSLNHLPFDSESMQLSNFFLRTKLLPPRVAPNILDRPRLIDRLRANLSLPITLIAADAGSGKTTLISEFVRSQSSRPAVWYQLDHTDADPSVFIGYLVRGIRDHFPCFGEQVLLYLSENSDEIARFPERPADLLINEILTSIEQPFLLVLDDYHHIGRATAVHRIVDRLVTYSSELTHIVITTRDFPPLAVMRRRTQFPGMLITREELLFTDDEVRSLFRETLGIELRDEEIAAYRERTHGWVTALQLIRQIADQEMQETTGNPRPNFTEILNRSEKDIFDYFAEEVFSRESAETRKILLSLSVMETLPIDVCLELFPDANLGSTLPELAQRNVFLSVTGDGKSAEEYRFHPLFRDFLLRRLRSEVGRSGLAAERNRIAEYYIGRRQWEIALPFLIAAENYEKAASLIAERGDRWISAGAFSSLVFHATKIPSDVLEKYPRAILHLAEIARLEGNSERSAIYLNKSVELLRAKGDREGEAEALHSLATLERRKGNLMRAYDLLSAAEAIVPTDSETAMRCANTRGLCLIAEGKHSDAEQQFRFALKLAEQNANIRYIRLITHNLALSPGYRGDFAEALRWFKRIFSEEDDIKLPQEAIGHLNIARLHLYRGEFEQAETHLHRSLDLCLLFNLSGLRGEILEAFGNLHRDLGDFSRAMEFYERAADAYSDAGISVTTRELQEEIARLHLLRGELSKARYLLETLIAERKEADNKKGVATAELLLCRVAISEENSDIVIEDLRALAQYFAACGNHYDEAIAVLTLAEAFCAAGDRASALPHIQRALDLSERFDYEYWLRGEIRRNPDLFAIDEIADRIPADLQLHSESNQELYKSAVAQPAIIEERALFDLSIKLLGPVEIARDSGPPIPSGIWTTRRARDIFCFIATSTHRRVSKDILIDTFWPEDDSETIEKNFHPTISHIRKALNKNQKIKHNFILFRDGAYLLNPELTYFLDTDEFELYIAEAEKSRREKDLDLMRDRLEAAYRLYRGDFMEGVYEPWAETRRNYYNEQFQRVLAALAKHYFGLKKLSSAQQFANELLRFDPYREDVHRLIMKIYALQGKKAAVKKHFDSLADLLRTELGIEPTQETRRLVNEILR
jgi:LuxR family maltose regulon positive regulatory protein